MPIDVTPAPRLSSTRIPRKFGVATLVMVAIAALYLRWSHAPAWNFVDLADFYYGGVSVLRGDDIYAPRPDVLAFNYPPFAAVAFVPLALMGLSTSKVAFTVATLVAYVVSVIAGRRSLDANWGTTVLIGAAGLALEPVVRVLVLGQVGIILMALILADCFLMPARFRGLLVGIAAGIKLTPVLFVLYFVMRRDWRATAVAIGAAAVTVVVGWIAAPASSRSYWLGGFDKLDRFGDLALSPVNQSVRSFVSRVAPSAPEAVLWAGITVAAVLSLSTAVVLGRRGHWTGVALTLAGATLMLSPISWTHHWVWVVPALLTLVHRRRILAAAIVALFFYVAPMWVVPETGSLTTLQMVLAYAYLIIAVILMTTAMVIVLTARRRPALTEARAS